MGKMVAPSLDSRSAYGRHLNRCQSSWTLKSTQSTFECSQSGRLFFSSLHFTLERLAYYIVAFDDRLFDSVCFLRNMCVLAVALWKVKSTCFVPHCRQWLMAVAAAWRDEMLTCRRNDDEFSERWYFVALKFDLLFHSYFSSVLWYFVGK